MTNYDLVFFTKQDHNEEYNGKKCKIYNYAKKKSKPHIIEFEDHVVLPAYPHELYQDGTRYDRIEFVQDDDYNVPEEMVKYVVKRKEVWVGDVVVSLPKSKESVRDAIIAVEKGEGKEIDTTLEFSHFLSSRYWTVENDDKEFDLMTGGY